MTLMNAASQVPPISEEQFQEQVIALAKLFGWTWHHERDARRSTAGYPDLTLMRQPRLLFVELKTNVGRVRPEQKHWLAGLAACGLETYLWRPRDWPTIEATLRAPGRRS